MPNSSQTRELEKALFTIHTRYPSATHTLSVQCTMFYRDPQTSLKHCGKVKGKEITTNEVNCGIQENELAQETEVSPSATG